MKLTKGTKPANTKGICLRCEGSGNLLRPTKDQLCTFQKCTNCQGHGVRFRAAKPTR